MTNRFSALEDLGVSNVDYIWVEIKDSIKVSVTTSLAKWSECQTYNCEVTGSIPCTSTILNVD